MTLKFSVESLLFLIVMTKVISVELTLHSNKVSEYKCLYRKYQRYYDFLQVMEFPLYVVVFFSFVYILNDNFHFHSNAYWFFVIASFLFFYNYDLPFVGRIKMTARRRVERLLLIVATLDKETLQKIRNIDLCRFGLIYRHSLCYSVTNDCLTFDDFLISKKVTVYDLKKYFTHYRIL